MYSGWRSIRSTPTGPGSRGGQYHEEEFRRAYHRTWRSTHPEYRERDLLRLVRRRAKLRGEDPALILAPNTIPRYSAKSRKICCCSCKCQEVIVSYGDAIQYFCGFCLGGLHREEM
jgi:hypothetical protein